MARVRLPLLVLLLSVNPLGFGGCAYQAPYEMGPEALEGNFKVVTHPTMVKGMSFIEGRTVTCAPAWNHHHVGNFYANELAKRGDSNMTILVEFVDRGMWRVAFYE